jgi:hypothetical protein
MFSESDTAQEGLPKFELLPPGFHSQVAEIPEGRNSVEPATAVITDWFR